MEVNKSMDSDTIVAIASGISNAGISMIRISGNKSLEIANRIFCKKGSNKKLREAETYTIHYGDIKEENEIIDEVIVLLMKAPKSYTREDVVEIDCHGGIIVTKKILDLIIKNGARPAEPGEFTKRAFLNGRIDLSQAEAVIDIIHAKNEMALKNSIQQLRGNVLTKIKEIRESILLDIAFIEAALDDPEHISFDGFGEKLAEHIKVHKKELQHLLKQSEQGRLLKEGIKTVIVGKPNAGKSSLLNLMLGEERAIVTEIAGTTRDTLEETIQIGGICLNIVDTAGIRTTKDIVEKIGVDKAKKIAEDADLILFVLDASTELDENDFNIIDLIQDKKVIIVLNKSDLPGKISMEDLKMKIEQPIVLFSAKKEEGLDLLETLIQDMFFQGKINFNDEIYITNIRQKSALTDTVDSLSQTFESIEAGMPEDFYSIDLMSAYQSLGSIIGETVEEDLIQKIFQKFCMGK